ncbi:MAG TPA: hypothetical protein VFS19_05035 [Planctomycetota bacterium]|nr:hypothetical protein [Planctomycetota bacterium]
MRSALIIAWIVAPLAAGAVHFYGPGQKWKDRDELAGILAKADALSASKDYAAAIEQYDLALQKATPDRKDLVRRLRLAKSHAMTYVGRLPEANEELESLLDDVSRDPKADSKLVDETRTALAASQHYMTWLLRLEGFPRTEWEPYIEGARQNFKVLAEGAENRGDAAAAKRMKEDLDSSIRLARMDLSDLQALPLPSQ